VISITGIRERTSVLAGQRSVRIRGALAKPSGTGLSARISGSVVTVGQADPAQSSSRAMTSRARSWTSSASKPVPACASNSSSVK
jgi:hypothetical protein